MPKWANGNDQMGQPIPDNKPEVKERRLYLSFNIPMDKNVVGGVGNKSVGGTEINPEQIISPLKKKKERKKDNVPTKSDRYR